MGPVQVPRFSLVTPPKAPTLPALPNLDPSVKGATRHQLELQTAGMALEYSLRSQDPAPRWEPGYREEYGWVWQPVKIKTQHDTRHDQEPERLLVLARSHQVPLMLEQAVSMLVLRPGSVVMREGREVIEFHPGPCLTVAQAHLQIMAHIPLDHPPVFPLMRPKEQFLNWSVAEIQKAVGFTEGLLPPGTYWLPMVHEPLGASVQRY